MSTLCKSKVKSIILMNMLIGVNTLMQKASNVVCLLIQMMMKDFFEVASTSMLYIWYQAIWEDNFFFVTLLRATRKVANTSQGLQYSM